MKKAYYILPIIAAFASCKKPYSPNVGSFSPHLVVEGVINPGPDTTVIYLSHTTNISSATTLSPLAHATVTVESNQNVSYPLTEKTPGRYSAPNLNFNVANQYRLRIKTPDNQQYLSDFVPVKITPPIDSVGFTIGNDGIQIYANTHDPNNNTHYYRWDYSETWAFHSMYFSIYVTNGTAIVQRTPAQYVYNCFTSDSSTTIGLGSSASLSQDVISQVPITQVQSASEKIETKYSIVVHQYALTSDAYDFWLNLKRNTEQLGSIFDAQPSTSFGNIHNINNPAEVVVGYIGASTVQSKRIFITNSQLPRTWIAKYPYSCSTETFLYSKPPFGENQVAESLIPLHSGNIPIDMIGGGFIGSGPECIDCTLRGTTQTPVFWQ